MRKIEEYFIAGGLGLVAFCVSSFFLICAGALP